MSQTPITSTPKNLKYSCVICSQRKVKCDRNDPCSNCLRAKVDCIPYNPAPPRRRKKKAERDLYSRLKRCEEILKGYGARIDEDEDDDENEGDENRVPDTTGGKVVSQNGLSKYIDNNLWTSLFEELREQNILQPSKSTVGSASLNFAGISPDGSSLLLFSNPLSNNLSALHPSPLNIFRLWQAFLDNVNPLSKIVHAPTVQCQILEATGNITLIPPNIEALLFSIYTGAIASLNDEDCEVMMGETRPVLLARYTAATQQALVKVGLLQSSDFMVLQALLLFLLALRPIHDPHALWVLSGVAVRISQHMGVHRDSAKMGLSVFETEMRRRLWYQLVVFDIRGSHHAGIGSSLLDKSWDVKLPGNFNDSDLYPEMTEVPLEHTGSTEMKFCLMTYEFTAFFKELGITLGWQNNNQVPPPEVDKWVNMLGERIQDKFLKYCDPSIPIHALTDTVARSIIANKRLTARHPRTRGDKGASMSQEEKDMLFDLSMQIIGFDSLTHSSKVMKRFLWHVSGHFQLDVFVFLLTELKSRPSGPLSDRAWILVEDAYRNHPELISDDRNDLRRAVGDLTMLVWEPRELELQAQTQGLPETPSFISALRLKRLGNGRAHEQTNSQTNSAVFGGQAGGVFPTQSDSNSGVETHQDPISMEMTPFDWDYWNSFYDAQGIVENPRIWG